MVKMVWSRLEVTLLLVAVSLSCQLVLVSGDGAHAHSHEPVSDDQSEGQEVKSSSAGASAATSSGAGAGSDRYAAIAKAISSNPTLSAYADQYLASQGGGQAGGAYDLPPPPVASIPPFPGFPGGFGGIPFGFGKGFNLNIDAGAGLGGYGVYLPIIKKVVVIVGGAILILLFLAFIQGSLLQGGFLNRIGGSLSEALGVSGATAASGAVKVGPFSASGSQAISAGAGAGGSIGGGGRPVNVNGARPNDPNFNARVNEAIDRRF